MTIRKAICAAMMSTAVPLFAQTASVGISANDLSGVQMVGPGTALVWAEKAQEFHIWRLQLGTKPRWTEVAEPEEVSAFKHAQNPADERDRRYVKVNVRAGIVRLLWLRHSGCEDKEWQRSQMNSISPCEFTLYEAAGEVSRLLVHESSAWHMRQSRLTNIPVEELLRVNQIRMPDNQDGWMLLQGDSQMNQMPEALVATSDGGKQWIRQKATGMPITNDYPQLLLPQSPDEAWFLSSQPFGMWHTTDHGTTWTRDNAISADFQWCKSCSEGSAWMAPSSQGRPCFDVELDSILARAPAGQSIARYRLTDDGKAWMAPIRLPVAGGGDTDHIADSNVFANQRLGFSAVTVAPAYTSTVYETRNGGATWHKAEMGAAGSDVRVEQASARGKNVLLLLWNWKTGVEKLMYSPDSGEIWSELEMPHSNVAD